MNYNLPFENEELWEYLRSNSYLSERYKLFYVATPKVACTSLKWWFASLSNLSKDDFLKIESYESSPNMVVHDGFRKIAPNVTGLQPSELVEPLTSSQYFRFAVVRNPYSRIFSAWQSKLLLREPLQSAPFLNCDFFNHSIFNGQDIASSFEGFLEHLLSIPETYFDAHWKPQFKLLRPDLINYSRIIKLEHVDDLIDGLKPHLNSPIPMPFDDPPHNESLIPYSKRFVTSRSVEIIQQLYSKDFKSFGYDTCPTPGQINFSTRELTVAIQAVELIRGKHQRLSQINSQWQLRLAEEVRQNNEQTTDLQNKLSDLQCESAELRNRLAAVYGSGSWKVTRPLRAAKRIFTSRNQYVNRLLSGAKVLLKQIQQNGLAGVAKKVIYKVKYPSTRYSSVPRVGALKICARNNLEHLPKKLTLISMLKNEKSVIETFAAHALAVFDRVIFIDHRSTDGTGTYLKSLSKVYPRIEYFLFDEAGYYQSEIMTWVVKNIVGSADSDWVFFLDADEYLPFPSRNELDEQLAKYASLPVISLPWLNLVPVNTETDEVKGGLFFKPSRTAIYHKIAFQPHLIPLDDYVVAQGNHALLIGESYQQTFPAEEAFPIYHIPIRTKQQLRAKIQNGVEAYRSMGLDREEELGFHWDEMSRLIQEEGLSDELMADMVARYGEPLVPPYGKSAKDMIQEGYTQIKLEICMAEQIIPFEEDMAGKDIDSSYIPKSFVQENLISKRGFPIVLDPKSQVLRFEIHI